MKMKVSNILIVTMLLMTALVGIGTALVPPPPPPPPVPQHIGLQDISIVNLTTTATDQSACRVCHQTSGTNLTLVINGSTYVNTTVGGVPTRHHSLLPRAVTNPMTGTPFACQDCHPSTPGVGMGILLDRSCLDCHAGLNFTGNSIGGHVGNITRPHHVNTAYASSGIGNPAQSRVCNFCHGSVVDNYNDSHYVPSYATDFMITPFASFKATNFSQPDGLNGLGGNMNFTSGVSGSSAGNKTWGGCYSCHLSNYSATPQAIGSNHDNHHNSINGLRNAPGKQGTSTPGETCSWCHVTNSAGRPYEFNIVNAFTGETLINAMEVRNNTIELSDIANGYVEFSSPNGTVTLNGTGCEKCHDVKSLHNIQFGYVSGGNGPQGQGHVNNNVDCYGCHNSWLPADSAPMAGAIVPTVNTVSPSTIAVNTPTTLTFTGINFVNDAFTSVVTVDGVTYIPTSVTETQIVVDIPALAAGTHIAQVLKGGDTLSNLETLDVVSAVALSSASLSGTTLTLTGVGLGTTGAAQNVLVGSTGYSASIVSWADTQVVATVSGTVNAGDTVEVIAPNGEEATAIVTIAAPPDTTPPVITVNGVNPVTVALNSVYTDAGATALDAVDGPVAVVMTGSVNTTIGNYTITYTATDKAGNIATATRTVNVVKSVLTKLPVTPSSATVSKKGKQTFTVTANDQFGKPMSKISITWSSSVTNVGIVSPLSATTGSSG
jgi:hypothetical protein